LQSLQGLEVKIKRRVFMHKLNPNIYHGLSSESTLGDMARHLQSLLPVEIPVNYPIKPMFTNIEIEENIRNGMVALLDFMRLFYGLLAEISKQYDKPKPQSRLGKTPSIAVDFPFIYHARSILLNIGYNSKLNDNVLSFCGIKTLNPIICCEGMEATTKISMPKLISCIGFLNDCGMYFEGLDFDTPSHCMADDRPIEVTYPDNPVVLVGLKIMAVAQRDLQWKTKDEVFLRCDYHALASDLRKR